MVAVPVMVQKLWSRFFFATDKETNRPTDQQAENYICPPNRRFRGHKKYENIMAKEEIANKLYYQRFSA